MSTNEEQTPLGPAPEGASSQNGEPTAERAAEPPVDPAETLSPAVRRLVRQFDLDITGIHGTGPAGRIRVGDVMGLLNGRTDSGNRDAPARPADTDSDLDAGDAARAEAVAALPAATAQVPTSTIFDCDLGRVLAHRKQLRLEEIELLTTSYFLTALAAALDAAPEVTAGHAPRFGVLLTTTDGGLRSALLDTAAVAWDSSLDERVRAVDAALRANLDVDVSAANLLVHHYGESGSLLATPTPIGSGHAASIGIGRLRREIAVRTNDGVETPRVATRCYLSLSFFEHSVPLHHANRALAAATGILERWP
jgi:pyruvate/2-oxoglutarate dehydrogenase complex dihydrolipoamide acyltransferase (E2) component